VLVAERMKIRYVSLETLKNDDKIVDRYFDKVKQIHDQGTETKRQLDAGYKVSKAN
jgi:hypothetical protein